MNNRESKKLLNEWVTRLGLQEWRIQLRINCLKQDLTSIGCDGEVEYVAVSRNSVIRIISKEEFGDRIIAYDFERILVHELLHLKMEILENESLCCHQLLDDLARALVCAKRGTLAIPLSVEKFRDLNIKEKINDKQE